MPEKGGVIMVSVQSPPEGKFVDIQNVIQESAKRIGQALEKESLRVKEQAEQDSIQILKKAKEEAELITAESRQKAMQAWKEPEQVISEAKKQASLVMAKIIEHNTSKLQCDFDRVAVEAKNRIAQVAAETNQSVEQIIQDIQNNLKAELENLSKIINEAESKLQAFRENERKNNEFGNQTSTEENNNDTKTQTSSIPESTKIKGEVKSQNNENEAALTRITDDKKEVNVPSPETKPDTQVKTAEEKRLFKGHLKLTIVSPYNQEYVGRVPEWLSQLPELKVLSKVSPSNENRWMTTYTIFLDKATPLLSTIKSMPPVKNVSERDGNFVMVLK
jgi:hypothetical protein